MNEWKSAAVCRASSSDRRDDARRIGRSKRAVVTCRQTTKHVATGVAIERR